MFRYADKVEDCDPIFDRCRQGVSSNLLYHRNSSPLGKSWAYWAEAWYKWMISIPTEINPCLDLIGKYCSVNQYGENVWFLAGTFGNSNRVKRKCSMPLGKAILLPILVKEDSFAEDTDLHTDADLIKRAKESTDNVLYLEAAIDGLNVTNLVEYRVQSEVFNVVFPEKNVYDVEPGLTRSVCDGFWLFIKPLLKGEHQIHFRGGTRLVEPYIKNVMRERKVYYSIKEQINDKSVFKLDVTYDLTIVHGDHS